ncbi:O-antigen ligase family protein [Pseudomonas sp. HK3]
MNSVFGSKIESSQSVKVWVLFILFSLFLVSLLVVPDIAKIFAVFLLVFGVVDGTRFIKAGFKHGLCAPERYLVWAFAGFSLVSVVSFIYWPYTKAAHYHFEDYLVFILVIPLFLVMRQVKFSLSHLIVVLALIAVCLGCLSLFQYWHMKTQGGFVLTSGSPMAQFWLRPSGGVNPMRYAAICLIFMGFAINAALFVRNKPVALKVLLALAVMGSAIACMLAQVRGSWLALIAMLAVYILVLFYVGHKKLLLGFLVVCVFGLGVLIQQPQVQQRLDSTEQSLQRYLDGNSHTSLGARLDMFKAAWILIKEHPIFGHGLNSYSEKATEIRLATPGMNREVGMWSNPHNEVLQVMVEKGVIGLATLIAIFASCAYLFISAYRNNKDNNAVAYFAFGGLIILVVYFMAGLSVALFEHNVFNQFFTIVISVFAGQVYAHRDVAMDESVASSL